MSSESSRAPTGTAGAETAPAPAAGERSSSSRCAHGGSIPNTRLTLGLHHVASLTSGIDHEQKRQEQHALLEQQPPLLTVAMAWFDESMDMLGQLNEQPSPMQQQPLLEQPAQPEQQTQLKQPELAELTSATSAGSVGSSIFGGSRTVGGGSCGTDDSD